MDADQKCATWICGFVAVVLCVLIGTIGAYYAYVKTRLIEAGYEEVCVPSTVTTIWAKAEQHDED